MFPVQRLGLAASLFVAACAPTTPPPHVIAPGVPTAAASAASVSVPEAPAEPEVERQCAGTPPQPEKKTHRDWPPPPRATCCHPDKEGIQRVIHAGFPAMKQCYESAMRRSRPDLKGRVSVKFTVQSDGSVPFACDSGSEIADREMVDCVLRAFLGLRFPEQSGDFCPKTMSIVYPIVFQPE